jgi:hypothetical protein
LSRHQQELSGIVAKPVVVIVEGVVFRTDAAIGTKRDLEKKLWYDGFLGMDDRWWGNFLGLQALTKMQMRDPCFILRR